jgi:hypothetical protein
VAEDRQAWREPPLEFTLPGVRATLVAHTRT